MSPASTGPNLTYRVLPKNKPYDQSLAFLRARPEDSGIVYCQSRKSAERVAANLDRGRREGASVSCRPHPEAAHASIRNFSCATTCG